MAEWGESSAVGAKKGMSTAEIVEWMQQNQSRKSSSGAETSQDETKISDDISQHSGAATISNSILPDIRDKIDENFVQQWFDKMTLEKDSAIADLFLFFNKGKRKFVSVPRNQSKTGVDIWAYDEQIKLYTILSSQKFVDKIRSIIHKHFILPSNEIINIWRTRAVETTDPETSKEIRLAIKSLDKQFKDLCDRIGRRGAVDVKDSIIGKLPEEPDYVDQMNRKKWVLPVRGGRLVEFKPIETIYKDGKKVETLYNIRERTQDDLFNFECPFDPTVIDEEKIAEIKTVLEENIDPEQLPYLASWTRQIMAGDNKIQMILWLIGPEGCGKSLFLQTLCLLLGKLGVSLDASDLSGNGRSSGGPKEALMSIVGARMAYVDEVGERDVLEWGGINRIAGGGLGSGNKKYGEQKQFIHSAIICFATNNYPKNDEKNMAAARKIREVQLITQHLPRGESDEKRSTAGVVGSFPRTNLSELWSKPEYLAAFFHLILRLATADPEIMPDWAYCSAIVDVKGPADDFLKWLQSEYEIDLSVMSYDGQQPVEIFEKYKKTFKKDKRDALKFKVFASPMKTFYEAATKDSKIKARYKDPKGNFRYRIRIRSAFDEKDDKNAHLNNSSDED